MPKKSCTQIICPVVRDVPGDDIDDVKVSILNVPIIGSMENTECCLYAFTFDGLDSEVKCKLANPNKTASTGKSVGRIAVS